MGVGKVPSDDVHLNDFTEVEGMDDGLADSEGEMDSNVLYRATATTGRKFRMVVIEMEMARFVLFVFALL